MQVTLRNQLGAKEPERGATGNPLQLFTLTMKFFNANFKKYEGRYNFQNF